MVRNDRVEHPHAPLVEHAHDRLLTHELRGERLAQLAFRLGHFHVIQRRDVVGLVSHAPLLQPAAEVFCEPVVAKILAPQRAVFDTGLGERPVEVQHADESRPRPRPIGEGEDRPAMRDQPGEHVVRILPDGFGDDKRRVGIDPFKDAHPFLLRTDEPVLLAFLVGMRPDQFISGLRNRACQRLFHLPLRRPALLIGALPQVAAGNEQDLVLRNFSGARKLGDCRILCHN